MHTLYCLHILYCALFNVVTVLYIYLTLVDQTLLKILITANLGEFFCQDQVAQKFT